MPASSASVDFHWRRLDQISLLVDLLKPLGVLFLLLHKYPGVPLSRAIRYYPRVIYQTPPASVSSGRGNAEGPPAIRRRRQGVCVQQDRSPGGALRPRPRSSPARGRSGRLAPATASQRRSSLRTDRAPSSHRPSLRRSGRPRYWCSPGLPEEERVRCSCRPRGLLGDQPGRQALRRDAFGRSLSLSAAGKRGCG